MLTILEHPSSGYKPRTIRNAKMADITVAFAADFTTSGEKLTKLAADGRYVAIPHDGFCATTTLVEALYETGKKSVELNIAGNGIYTLQKYGISQCQVNLGVYYTLKEAMDFFRIHAVRCGGQTGADIAGAVAGVKLGLPTTVLMPRGFRQRNADGVDIYLSEAMIRQQIEAYAALL